MRRAAVSITRGSRLPPRENTEGGTPSVRAAPHRCSRADSRLPRADFDKLEIYGQAPHVLVVTARHLGLACFQKVLARRRYERHFGHAGVGWKRRRDGLQDATTSSGERTSAESRGLPHREATDGLRRPPHSKGGYRDPSVSSSRFLVAKGVCLDFPPAK